MTTPTSKLTGLTDPDNVAWVVEEAAPTEVTATLLRLPKMRAYSELVAAISLKKKFDESKVKRGPGGKFAKKAGSKTAAPPPAKKTAAPAAPTPGKKMTNKIVYGKHANGTVIETSDGQHRMIFNAAGNNWTFQRRTPDGGWETVDVLGKGASYKKAHELSDQWGAPHEGTPAELTPVPGPTAPSGAFTSGWDDLGSLTIDTVEQQQAVAAMKKLGINSTTPPDILEMYVADVADVYGIDPAQLTALLDASEGGTAYSDTLKAHLGTKPFTTPPGFAGVKATIQGLKKTATKKTAAKKTTASAPTTATVAPSPPPVAAPATTTSTFTATTNPYAVGLAGGATDLAALETMATESLNVYTLRQQANQLYHDPTSTQDEIDAALDTYAKAHKAYLAKYGIPWSSKHHVALTDFQQKQSNSGVTPTVLPKGSPIPGANVGVEIGETVVLPNGVVAEVVDQATTSTGDFGVMVKLPDGSTRVSAVYGVTPLTGSLKAKIADIPHVGATVQHSTLGAVTVVSGPVKQPIGGFSFQVQTADGKTQWTTANLLEPATTATSTPKLNKGDEVDTPLGPGKIMGVSADGKMYTVQKTDGAIAVVSAQDVTKVTAPASAPSGGVAVGDTVSTPGGDAIVVGMMPDGSAVQVKYPAGGYGMYNSSDVAPVSATTPATVAPTTTPSSGATTYDANGVPLLTASQQYSLQAHFQNAGVAWYNPSEKLFDAAYAASQATGLSIEDVLKYADANFHNSAKDGGKPIQAKVAKWAKSSKGKAHIASVLGTSAASPITPTPAPAATPIVLPGSPPGAGVGAQVTMINNWSGTIVGVTPDGNYILKVPTGDELTVKAKNIKKVITPVGSSAAAPSTPTPAPTASPSTAKIGLGDKVWTPQGPGTVTSVTPSGAYVVQFSPTESHLYGISEVSLSPIPIASTNASLPGTPTDISGVPTVKQTQAFTQFTAGYTTLSTEPGLLAQKAVDVAKNTGLTPEQVLAIVDAKKATLAGVPNTEIYANKVLGHLNGKSWPAPSPTPVPPKPSSGGTKPTATPFPVTPGSTTVTHTEALALQNSMAAGAPLTPGQRSALTTYTGSKYGKINGCLRYNTGCTPGIKKTIANGTAAMRPTTQNITTFRGTSLSAFGVSSIAQLEKMAGKTVTEPGFSSTSISPGSAFGGQVTMQIDIPAGTPGSYVDAISQHPGEKEFVLPPGTKFRIVQVKPANGGYNAVVHVEVVPA